MGGGGGAIFTLGTLFLFILFIHPAQIAMYYVRPPPPKMKLLPMPTLTHVYMYAH